MSAVIAAQNISKTFGKVEALKSISFEQKAGTCLAILGPNGAGKTTLIEILEGLINPDAGSFQLFGKSYAENRDAILQKMGVVLQETSLYKKFTVKETLELFASFFAKSVPIEGLVNQLGLKEKLNARLESLSGGQKQRVYLGCAMVNAPDLLFLDEPTTGLDPQARRYLWDLLLEWKRAGKSILLTTHFMDEAEYLADNIVIMDHGKIIARGTPSQLISEVCGDQLLVLQCENAKDANTLTQHVALLNNAAIVESNIELATRAALEVVAAASSYAKANNLAIKAMNMRNNTLEDVFLRLTGRSLRDAK